MLEGFKGFRSVGEAASKRAGLNGQAATLEQQRLTARGLGGSCREEAVQQLEGCKGFEAGTLTASELGGSCREGCAGKRAGCKPWNSKGWRPEGLVEAAARELEGFKGFKGLKPGKRQAFNALTKRGLCAGKGQACNAGTLTARSLVEAAARDVQAKGRLQPWNSKGWRPEGLVEAAARKHVQAKGRRVVKGFEGCLKRWQTAGLNAWKLPRGLCAGKGQAAMLERWRPGAWWKLPRGMCRQRAGCNPGTAKADGQRASWKLPRGSWRVLRVLSVWSLANGRLECPNKRGLCAGKGQAAMLERWRPGAWWKLPRGMCRQRAGCNPGTAKADGQRAWWQLPRGMCRQRAGCNPGTAKADGQRAWWKLPRGSVQGFKGFKGCNPLNSKGWQTARGLGGSCREKAVQQLARWRQRARGIWNPGTAKADGQRAWWKLPRGMCRQRAGCNPGTAKAAGQRAWWQLPRGSSAAVGGGSCREGVGGF